MNYKYLPIIGMEIHVELKTKSKMFCGCKNDPFHAEKPNIYTCPVCLGLPGALPVPNKRAIEWTMMLGLALNCEIPTLSKFDRKNYFYPDLPKGYQISQYDQPIARNGVLNIKYEKSNIKNIGEKEIRINRVHLEEDTGKLLHHIVNDERVTLIDFNRSGVPLVEIVTEPDIHSAEEAKQFLKNLHQIIRYLGISDADMEKGSMRLEPNISVVNLSLRAQAKQSQNQKIATSSRSYIGTPRNDNIIELPPYKVEVKNINSFNFVKKAIDYEVGRQIELLEKGQTPKQETRGWDEKRNMTLPQRSKEEAHDYRYFPEPDIPPLQWTEYQVSSIKCQVPELPEVKLSRFIKSYGLPLWDAERLVETREMAEYFEKAISYQLSVFRQKLTARDVANWLLNKNIDITKVKPEELIKQIAKAKEVVVIDEDKLNLMIDETIDANLKAVADYKNGKEQALMFLVGQIMRDLKGKGNAQLIRSRITEKLK